MTDINSQWIETGTTALMAALYGSDLGGADYGDMFDSQVQMHREQVTDVLKAVVPLIAGDRERRAAELRERLLDLVGDFAQASIAETSAALDLTSSSELVAERTAARRGIHDEIVHLSAELRNLTRLT